MCSRAFIKVKELEAKAQRHKAHPSRLRCTPLKGRSTPPLKEGVKTITFL